MQPDRWRQIDELLEQALDISPEERPAFLDAACERDQALRAQVEKLLRAHEHADRFLAVPALVAAAGEITKEQTGTLIGRTLGHYEVTSRLGAGGMGVVYLARDTRLERMVALKVLPLDVIRDEEQKLRFLREAKASAALEHPNIGAIHEIAETADGQMFIVMGYYEGDSLKQRIQQGPLAVNEALDIASQIAAGLSHAHGRDVVHRDVKPGNILVTREGVVKLIDFGLAKLGGLSKITRTDRIMGTVAYLSPEQARGEGVDERTDVWSLGAVLYEMLAAQVPFHAEHPEATIHSILTGEPKPLSQLRADVPVEIDRIISKALQKDPKSRYSSAAELLKDLAEYQSGVILPAPTGGRLIASWLSQKRVAIPPLLILILLGSFVVWSVVRQNRAKWARETLLPEIGRLVDQDQYAAALELAREAERYIPTDPQLVKLWPVISTSISVKTTPPGADVYMKEYHAVDSEWAYLGRSPLENIRIPPGLFRWKIEKTGFATTEDLARSRPVSFLLDPLDTVPDAMVRVPGGRSPNNMTVSGFESVEAVQLQDYWMDRYELTNKQFKRFVDGGGYQKREYWKHAFVKEGRVVSWDSAMKEFRDATGRPGPSTWEAGDYPKGQDDDPVGGVSWYEAAAFCEFAGKSLPTVYHWNRAAINGEAWFTSHILPYSNFAGRGPARVGSHQGMSRSGTYDLAGNVKEWSWNEAGQRKRYILGGAWNEPAYMFHEADARAPFQRDATFGFRCIKYLPQDSPSARLTEPVVASARNYAKEQPVSENVFRVYRDLYAYDKTPLNAAIESTDTSETDWIKHRITVDAAYGDQRMAAYLFLPRNAEPPYQTIAHFPGAESIFVRSSDRLIEMPRIDFILKSGRAVLWPIYNGTYERPDEMQTYFPNTSIRYRDHVIQWAKDLGRSIDYLETRSDIDHNRLGFYGYSWGAAMGAILPAVENRLKVSVLMGPGLYLGQARPEVDQINFAPRVTIPTLIVDGRDDFVFPRETSQEPFYRLLGTPEKHKRLVVFEGGHSVPRHHLIRESLDWLDRYLGPVQRTRQ
jgi:serine/threonine protein kinase/formylglycine-generating enzyme required for sulfatase activity/dienelactone hydrolase